MNERNNTSFISLVIQSAVISVFVLALIYFFPTGKQYFEKTVDNSTFTANLVELKEASLSYFQGIAKPKEVGDEKVLTLKELYDEKIVPEIYDGCDLQSSKVRIVKLDDEYKVRTDLVCGDQSDYLIGYIEFNNEVVDNDKTPTPKPTTPTNNGNTSNKVKYYEYYTETSKQVPYQTTQQVPYRVSDDVDICAYKPLVKTTTYKYILGYTQVYKDPVTGLITGLREGRTSESTIDLPDGAINVELAEYKTGYSYFDINTYKYDVLNGRVTTELGTLPSSVNDNNSYTNAGFWYKGVDGTWDKTLATVDAKTGKYLFEYYFHLYDPYVYNTVTTSPGTNNSCPVGYVLKDSNCTKTSMIKTEVTDSKLGEIIYIPIRIKLEYDMPSSSTITKYCDDLTSAEEALVSKRYTTTKTETLYITESVTKYKTETTKSEKKWTTDPKVKGYIYTGEIKYVDKM